MRYRLTSLFLLRKQSLFIGNLYNRRRRLSTAPIRPASVTIKNMKDSKRIWVWIGVAIVVIAVIVLVVWKLTAKPKPAGPVPVFAPQGQLVPNFPKELILDPQAQVASSYSINYDSSTNQYTAEWASSSSLATLYGEYQKYFGTNGWAITNQSGVKGASKLAVLYAATTTANVNVTLVSQGKGSEATISYVAH